MMYLILYNLNCIKWISFSWFVMLHYRIYSAITFNFLLFFFFSFIYKRHFTELWFRKIRYFKSITTDILNNIVRQARNKMAKNVHRIRKWENVRDRVRARVRQTHSPVERLPFPYHPRPAIVSLGDNPWTTWQVKFCIHGSAGDIGARLNEPLYLLLWFQRGPPTAEEYSFKYLSILELDAAAYPRDGLMCPAAGSSCTPCARILFCMYPYTSARDADVWSLSQVFSIHFYNLTVRAPLGVYVTRLFRKVFFFFVYRWHASNIGFAKYTLLTA